MLDTAVGLLPIPAGFSLSYSSTFLECVPTSMGMEKMPYDVVPPPPVKAGLAEANVEESAGYRTLWKGELWV